MPSNADLGQAIRRLRWDRDLSIEALAFTAGMHPTYLGRIERGGASPTWGKITSIARALDVGMVILVRNAEQESEVARAASKARARIEAYGTHSPNSPFSQGAVLISSSTGELKG